VTELAYDPDIDLSEYIEGIRDALAAFVDSARRAGLDAEVPTCPSWTVRRLIAHTGMIHRWATAQLHGERDLVEPAEGEAGDVADPVAWLHDGGLELADAIDSAPDDVDALVFLHAAPESPRVFWARRQCHETTIHSVDALGAALGRLPRAADTGITREIAADGIDELVRGFVTRSRSGLRSETPVSFSIRPSDVAESWQVQVSSEPAVSTRSTHGHEHADVVLEGTAVQLYLALWNRSDELQVDGFDLWRRTARVV
jgi:uncharacterized protein (TIGR03083 family)